MKPEFILPTGLLGRFAVVKLWPEMKTAEDECIARLKIAASALGIECVEVDAEGIFLNAPEQKASKTTVDFVIHLHYDTPKRYDAFSFVALWNPLKFYHEWGYARCSRNLTTHDDFISCSSDAADDHVARMIRETHNHLPAKFHLYHSTADIIHPPSLGAGKLFYAGINWEAVSGGKSRHQEVLKRLDKTGLLRIYGPTVFSGVRVWAGYESYVREIPFDGFSMIDEISNAGIALVLSSQAHKDSELMSNRLFESIAAGALIICDENPFAKRFFGDSLLYIDSRSPIEEIHADILRHIEWASQNPEAALAKIQLAQDVFREKFTLTRNLSDLYTGFLLRKKQLLDLQNPPQAERLNVRLNMLMPEYSHAVLHRHLQSLAAQIYRDFSAVLVVDKNFPAESRTEINTAIAASHVSLEVLELDYSIHGIHQGIKADRRLGALIHDLLGHSSAADAFMVVAPNESFQSGHLAVLAGALRRDPTLACASTAALLPNGSTPLHSVHDVLDFGHVNRLGPCGYGRFIFRTSAIPKDIGTAIRYLDGRPLAVLVGSHAIAQQLPATISIDLQAEFLQHHRDDVAEQEVIRSYSPEAFKVYAGPRQIVMPIQTATVTPVTTAGQLMQRLVNRRWVTAQLHAIRKQGLGSRIKVLKQRLSGAP